MIDHAQTLQTVARFLDVGDLDSARALIDSEYPFRPRASLIEAVREAGLPAGIDRTASTGLKQTRRRRKLQPEELHRLFVRDNYRCSYSGTRLVSPPALLLVSLLIPNEFPCTNYPNCPLVTTHIGLWFLYPSPDHVEAFAAGGQCSDENLVTTSSAVNMIKSGSAIAALNWPMPRKWDNSDGWDGLANWFRSRIETDVHLIAHPQYGSLFRAWAIAVGANIPAR